MRLRLLEGGRKALLDRLRRAIEAGKYDPVQRFREVYGARGGWKAWRRPTMNITDHFTWEEAACHDGTPVPPELQDHARQLAAMAEKIRARFGGAIVPVSWYRTPEHNTRVGGAPHSQHMEAWAMDARPADLAALPRLTACIEGMILAGELPELGGMGIYPAWVHIDCRPRPADGHIARWMGTGVGAEAAA